MTDMASDPIPLEPLKEETEDRRLWIGNLDPRISEFTLVKLLQTFGSLEKFDMLFHRSGPCEGQPRGYAFVTYSSKEIANTAIYHLNGMLLGNKKICVKWAHSMPKNDSDKQKAVPEILALGGKKNVNKLSRNMTIKAIEEKLKIMESTSESADFKITHGPTISQNSHEEKCISTKNKYLKRNKTKPYLKTNERFKHL